MTVAITLEHLWFSFPVKGVAKSTHAGAISAIASHASRIYADSHETPIIFVETENRYIFYSYRVNINKTV